MPKLRKCLDRRFRLKDYIMSLVPKFHFLDGIALQQLKVVQKRIQGNSPINDY